jgi:agmatinase
MKTSSRFLDIEPQYYDYDKASFVVVPVPYEATPSYGKGTKNGPAAILRASQLVEDFDEELQYAPYKKKPIYTLSASSIKSLPATVKKLIKENKIPVILGGEHSLTPHAVKVFAEKYKSLSVLQFDAHADLRNEYQGSKNSHACAMRRVLEYCPVVQVGIRSISEEEYGFARKTGQIKKIHWANKLELVEKIENQLTKNVYLTIDVDVFDPSVVPATGTPEPGGMFWYEILDILSRVCREKKIVGFDVVELAPIKGQPASDFTIARLIYKIMGYISSKL